MMTGQNIVCFAKDWSEDPTSNNHVMRLLAERNKVLWLNSITTRTPTFTSGSDVRKIGRKLKAFMRGADEVSPGLSVFTPVVLPFPHSAWAARLNQVILKASVGMLRVQRRMSPFQLWSFLPSAVRYVGKFGEELLVYYVTDEFSQFKHLDGQKMAAMDREMCERADIVFATAHTLVERKKQFNPETHLASHGVDHAHFASTLAESTLPAPEMTALPKGPVIGFVGLIESWIDVSLLDVIAERRPSWQIVLIGKSNVDLSSLKRHNNIYLLGRKPYAELPRYLKAFTVGVIPFVLNELTLNVNPIKLREYLSAGLPVVSSDIPEVRSYADDRDCFVAANHDQFLSALDQAVNSDTPEARHLRSQAMRRESWEQKVAELGDHVMRARMKKGLAPAAP